MHLLLGMHAIQHLTRPPWTGHRNSLKASKQVHLVGLFAATGDASDTCCDLQAVARGSRVCRQVYEIKVLAPLLSVCLQKRAALIAAR